MEQTHTLKTLPQYWDAVRCGDKTFEVRKDDRGFQKGDMVELVKVHPGTRHPDTNYDGSPKIIKRRIRYVLTGGQFGIEPGYVVLQLEDIP